MRAWKHRQNSQLLVALWLHCDNKNYALHQGASIKSLSSASPQRNRSIRNSTSSHLI